jgi:hypothetical protein
MKNRCPPSRINGGVYLETGLIYKQQLMYQYPAVTAAVFHQLQNQRCV